MRYSGSWRPGGEALLYEPHREIDIDAALSKIRHNMSGQNPLRRWGVVQLNRFALWRGQRIGMTLYSQRELTDLAHSSSFGENAAVEWTSLLKIPIFVCIHLWKPA